MPRCLLERTCDGGLQVPMTDAGADACLAVVGGYLDFDVAWVHS